MELRDGESREHEKKNYGKRGCVRGV